MSATSRYHLEPAPSGLFLVQDLVNTRGVPAYGVRDLLDTVTDAQRWVRTSVRTWQRDAAVAGGVRRLTSADLPALRRLRDEVERAVLREAGTPRELPARLAVDADGRVSLQPTGTGVEWLAGAVWGEVLAAQRDGSWDRLKVCRNPQCPCAFHDASRNNSRVWHDVHTCGNVANLRASRARRRTASS